MFSGLFQSQPKNLTKKGDLEKKINTVFTDYLLQQSFDEFNQPITMNKYNNDIYTTKETLFKALSELDIKNINNLTKNNKNKIIKISNLNLKKDIFNAQKKRLLIDNISNFYYKIYEIYNAIVSTLDPIYSYKDDNDIDVFFRLSDYKEHLQKIKNRKIELRKEYSSSSIINKRLRILYDAIDSSGNPSLDIDKVCTIDMQNDLDPEKLTDLKGIKELEKLFIQQHPNNIYKSKNVQKSDILYQDRLDYFYKLYTGKSTPRPSDIDSFDKVTLLKFDKKSKYCREPTKSEMKTIPKIEERFYKAYTKNLVAMNKSVEKRKKNLLKILNYIFIRKNDGTMIINPKIDEKKLIKISFQTIDNISRLYINIQKFFLQGLYIFDQIYKKHKKDIEKQRKKSLNEIMEKPIISAPRLNLKNNKSSVKNINISNIVVTKNNIRREIQNNKTLNNEIISPVESVLPVPSVGKTIKLNSVNTEVPLPPQNIATQMTPIPEVPAENAGTQMTPIHEDPAENAGTQMTPIPEVPAENAGTQMIPIPEVPAENAGTQMTPIPEVPAENAGTQMTPIHEVPGENAGTQMIPIPEVPAENAGTQMIPITENAASPNQIVASPISEVPAENAGTLMSPISENAASPNQIVASPISEVPKKKILLKNNKEIKRELYLKFVNAYISKLNEFQEKIIKFVEDNPDIFKNLKPDKRRRTIVKTNVFSTLKTSEQKIIDLNNKITQALTRLNGISLNAINTKIQFTTEKLKELDSSFEKIFNPISASLSELVNVQTYKNYSNYEQFVDKRIDTLNQQYSQLSYLAQ